MVVNDEPTPPSDTPNVVLQNPQVRKGLGWVVGLAAIIVPLSIVIDGASAAFDWADWTTPAAAATSFLAGLLGVVVTIPNIPKTK